MENTKINIRQLTELELKDAIQALGEKPFRAKQITEWLWKKGARTFGTMSDLPLKLRESLEENYTFAALKIDTVQQSLLDNTCKTRYITHDGHYIEGVLIPAPHLDLLTACVSSQIGCSLTCKFCATGKMNRVRNLTSEEIFDQYIMMNEQALNEFGKPLTNVVYMGMGEPMLNYNNVMESIERITKFGEFGFSPKRITISTAGIAKMITKMADDNSKCNLALSLHAANDTKRSEIMPINESNTLVVLQEALQHYYNTTGNIVTLEYILLRDFNDSNVDANELIYFARKVPCKVNIIEYNSIGDGQYQATSEDKLNAFVRAITMAGITINVRRSKGKDIDAACGQLANK